MIPVVELLYDIDLKLNKVATGKHQEIPLEDKIIALNDAQIQLIKQKISPNNVFRLGLDAFKKRYDDLENLVVPHVALVVTKDLVSKLDKYNSQLTSLVPEYMFYVDSYFLCDKGPCKDHIVTTQRIKHADIHVVLANANTRASFEYQEAPVTVSEHTLEFYTDGSFTPTMAYVSYLRYPQKVDFEGSIHFDGSASTTINSELNYYLKDELVDLAVQELALMTENQGAVQASQIRIQNDE